MPKSNEEYWEKKLRRNKSRDQEVNLFYQEIGWNLLRLWEHEFKEDFSGSINKIARFIRKNQERIKDNDNPLGNNI